MEIGLSLGSNLGDRLAHLQAAREAIRRLDGVALVAQAPVYETEPVGVKPEFAHLKFLNTVLILRSDRPAEDLQRELSGVEAQLGRVRGADRFAPRDIDIDLLFAGALWMETDRLILPHPRWAQRRFVVQPLADVRPDLVLPGAGCTVRAVLAALPPGEAIALFAEAARW
jgi:2-amino-4-hydroxy-6-hydroxymethyldihydropteridine diphosphokinase